MKAEEYTATQQQLTLLGQLINDLDLVGFIDGASKAETLGPILDPTLYKKSIDKLEKVKALAQAARTFQKEVHKQLAEERERKNESGRQMQSSSG